MSASSEVSVQDFEAEVRTFLASLRRTNGSR